MTESVLADNLVAYASQIAFLVTVDIWLPRILGFRAPRIKLAMYQCLLLGCLLLPLLQPWAKLIAPLPTIAPEPLIATVPKTDPPAPRVEPRPRRVTQVGTERADYSTDQVILLIIGTGILLRLIWLAFGLWRIKNFLRQSHLLSRIPLPVREMQALLGVYPRLYRSSRLKSPVSFGLARPVIVFPKRFMVLNQAGQSAVACHELLHIRRRDWISILGEEIACSILWFHPAIWWLARESRLVREQVVDQQVVEITGNWHSYVQTLIEMATDADQARRILAHPFSRRSQLVQRLELIISEPRLSRLRIAASLSAIVVTLFLTGFMSVSRLPLTASLSPPVSMESRVLMTHLIKKVEPVYPERNDGLLDRDVVLRVLVGQDGVVVRAEPLSGHPILGMAASKAVSVWRFKPIEIGQQAVPVVSQLKLRLKRDGETQIISARPLLLAMDKEGVLRDISLNSLSEEEIIQRLKGSQSSTRVYVSEEAPFDVVQERVRLLEQLGSAGIELSPEVLVSRGQQHFYSMHVQGLSSPAFDPEDLQDLENRARLLSRESHELSYRVFSDNGGQIVSVEHRAGPRSIGIESQLLRLKVTPGSLGVDPVPVAFLLSLATHPEKDATAPQVTLPESSRLFAYREGRLFYTHATKGILPPQVDPDYLDYVADRARRSLNSQENLVFRLFCEETGRVVSIERLGGSNLPKIEAHLTRAVVSPGSLRGVPVPVAFFVNLSPAD